MSTADRAEALMQVVAEACGETFRDGVGQGLYDEHDAIDVLRALVEAGGVTWEMVTWLRDAAIALDTGGDNYELTGHHAIQASGVADFLADLLTAAGVTR